MPPRKTTRKKAPKRPARKRPMDHNHIIRFLLIICGIVTFGIGSSLAWFFSLDIPNIQSVDDYRPLVTTTVLDQSGKMIDAIYEETTEFSERIARNQQTLLKEESYSFFKTSRFSFNVSICFSSSLAPADER